MVTLLTGTSGMVASPELVEAHRQDPALEETCVPRIYSVEYLHVIIFFFFFLNKKAPPNAGRALHTTQTEALR